MRRRLSFWHPASLIATGFGIGNVPIASGSWASLAALPVAWLIAATFGSPWLLAAAALALAAGLWASSHYCLAIGEKDPSRVVIDEIAGQWLALAPIAIPDPVLYAIGFFAFRILDIIKPWPAGWCDRELAGAPGVMFDDIAAGLYAALVVYGVILLDARIGFL
ncbi:MAG: phosphatidylglycerophosphatase A [Alphaproteobacteria bacterium]|nr:phosphatidylglycerophosphatase A [Alphaproteobacteria bacterium]